MQVAEDGDVQCAHDASRRAVQDALGRRRGGGREHSPARGGPAVPGRGGQHRHSVAARSSRRKQWCLQQPQDEVAELCGAISWRSVLGTSSSPVECAHRLCSH